MQQHFTPFGRFILAAAGLGSLPPDPSPIPPTILLGVVSEWARRRGLAEKADQSALARTPSAGSIARLMTLARDDLSKSDAVLIAAIENNVPELTIARSLIADFQEMIRSKAVAKLDGWLEHA